MTWFKVDDSLAFHRKVVAAGNAAMGLWVRAGSWSAQQLTDGHVPEHIAILLGTPAQASRLVRSGLWITVADGYRFHEWNEKGRQPTAQSVREARESSAERQAKWRAAKLAERQFTDAGNGVTPPLVTPLVTPSVTGAPTRPDPTRSYRAGLGGGATDPAARESNARARPPTHNLAETTLPGLLVVVPSGIPDAPPRCTSCAKLPPGIDRPCRTCGRLRRTWEADRDAQATAVADERAARRQAIDACGRCDPNGLHDTGHGLTRCNHQETA